jgi:hypothetical protein
MRTILDKIQYRVEPSVEGRSLALSSNIKLGWKWQALTNALAFSIEVLLTTIKSLIVLTLVLLNK